MNLIEKNKIESINKFLISLCNSNLSTLKLILADNSNCPDYILELLADDEDLAVKNYVAQNPNCNAETLHKLSKTKNVAIYSILNNKNCSLSTLEYFSDQNDDHIKTLIAQHKNCSSDLLRKFYPTKDFILKCAIAKNPNCPTDIFKKINSKNPTIKSFLLKFTNR